MSSISGIKNQAELESLPYFNKKTAEVLIGKKGRNLDKKISQLFNREYLLGLKKGFYLTQRYYSQQQDKRAFLEYLANVLYSPSYLSLEYVLSLSGLIPEGICALTSISLKSSRVFENRLGTFIYRNVKEELFCGYRQVQKGSFSIYIATKAKALFDFLYLKRNLSRDYDYDLNEGLRINWDVFIFEDFKELESLVKISKSIKMERFLKEIRRIKNVN